MTIPNKVVAVDLAEVYYLPQALIKKAEQILSELEAGKQSKIGLAMLSIYHQELDWLVKNFPPEIHGGYILAEVKSRRLACVIKIELMQTIDSI